MEVGGFAREGGEPMLTDFGLAKDVETGSRMTRSGAFLGTPYYIAPEQAGMKADRIDGRADVYSLGATLYEMLALCPPFDGETPVDVIRKALSTDPVPLRRVDSSVDRDLETITMKCLERDPDKRYDSAMALAADLERYLAGEPIEARPAGFLEKVLKKARRNKGIVAGLFVVVLVLGIGAVLGGIGLFRAAREKTEADRKITRAEDHLVEAESQAKRARAEEDRAKMLLEKNQKISRELLRSQVKLGKIHAELKNAFLDGTKTREAVQAVFARRREQLEAYERECPPDPPSRAVCQAVVGWLLWLGRREEEAFARFAASQRADPDVAWGTMFEAMVWLSETLQRWAPPAGFLGPSGLKFLETPDVSPESRDAMAKFENLLERARSAPAWGEQTADIFADVLSGLRGLHGGKLDVAEQGLTKALSLVELAWVEEEIRFARAKVRYLMMAFDRGGEDVRDLRDRFPENIEVYLLWGAILMGKGAVIWARGEDPRPLFRQSIEIYGQVLRKNSRSLIAISHQALAYRNLGEAEGERGVDPRPSFQNALKNLSAALERVPGNLRLRMTQGIVYRSLASAEAKVGVDPRPNFLRSIRSYEEVLRHKPDLPLALAYLGYARMYLAQSEGARGSDPRAEFERAIRAFERVLRASPGMAEALLGRGTANSLLGEWQLTMGMDPRETYAAAVDDLNVLLERDPDNFTALLNRGGLYQNIGSAEKSRGVDPRENFRKSIADCRAALRLRPDNAAVLTNRGNVRILLAEEAAERGDDPRAVYREGIADLDRSLKKNPNQVLGYIIRGRAWWVLGRAEEARGMDARGFYGKAIADFNEGLQRNPEDNAAFNFRGCVQISMGSGEERFGRDPREWFTRAVADFDEALRRNPEAYETYLNRGLAYSNLAGAERARGGDPRLLYRKAIADFGETLRRNPESARAHNYRGIAFKEMARLERRGGGDSEAWLKKAFADFDLALRKNPEEGDFYNNRAIAFLEQAEGREAKREDAKGSYRRAIEDLNRALQKKPRDANALNNRGNAHMNLGTAQAREGGDPRPSYRNAVEDYRAALRLNPRHLAVHNNLGLLYRALGETEWARGGDPHPWFERALKAFGEIEKLNPAMWQAHANRGFLLRVQGRFEEAATALEKAIQIAGERPDLVRTLRRVRGLTRAPDWLREMALGLRAYKQGDYAGAKRRYEKAFELGKDAESKGSPATRENFTQSHYAFACILAQLSVGKVAREAESRSVPDEEGASLRTAALDHLRKAFEGGWRDFDYLRKDTNLDPLRRLSAFDPLVKTWEEKVRKKGE
ncbi:MAG: tetratricopeptide repeat protein [Planctomycetota bacterium]